MMTLLHCLLLYVAFVLSVCKFLGMTTEGESDE